jgi:hypothetical protein
VKQGIDQQQVTWLEERAAEQPGHAQFLESRGRTLQNRDVIRSWKFAAAFTSKYVGKLGVVVICPPAVSFVSPLLIYPTGTSWYP